MSECSPRHRERLPTKLGGRLWVQFDGCTNPLRVWGTVILFLMLVLVMSVPLGFGQTPGATSTVPHWIGPDPNLPPGHSVTYEKLLSLQTPSHSLRLRYAPSYAHLVVSIDGETIAEAEAFDPIREFTLPERLALGEHSLQVKLTPLPGPSAFFLELSGSNRSSSLRIVSDSTWRFSSMAPLNTATESTPDSSTSGNAASATIRTAQSETYATDLGPVHPELLIADGLRVGIDVTDNYEQWKQAIDAVPGENESFFVAPEFEIRQVAKAGPDDGSWVSMVFDAQGRPIVAREDAGLIRLTFSADGSRVLKKETIETTLKECRGLTFVGDDLYANANNSKGLFVLRRRADQFAEPSIVFSSTGGVGHGRNDLTLGPDEKLYSIHGDAVDLPTNARDYTSAYREAKRGQKTNEGYLLRLDPKTGISEVLSAGLRNPFGIDFHHHGEAFTYDADAEYDMGAPWYRPTRVNHLVVGADYGWRGVTKQWPPYYPDHPDNTPANLDIGKGSPTAVKFGYRSNFPERYRTALFVLDWAYGRVLAVHPVARGASYLMTMETFLKGRPLNVTDLDFGPDGNLYLITGGRKTQSAMYQVRYKGTSRPPNETTTFAQDLETTSEDARQERRHLESMLIRPIVPADLDFAWKSLRDPDRWIQHAAMRVLERFPVENWKERAFAEDDPRTLSAALLCLTRSGKSDQERTIRRLLRGIPTMTLESDRLQAYYSIWQLLQSTDADASLTSEIVATLSPRFPSKSHRSPHEEDRILCQILLRLRASNAIRTTIDLINRTASPAQRLHFLFVLRDARSGWDETLESQYLDSLQQAEEALGGAGLPEFLRRIREDFLSNLEPERRAQLAADLSQPAPVSEVALPQDRPLVKKWTAEELTQQHTGNAKRGERVFRESGCIQCHRFGSKGTLLGPDLTSVSRRFGTLDLLRSILRPSDVIAENYRSVQILMQDGRSLVGQPLRGGDYRSPTLHLATDPMRPSVTIPIAKNEITEQKESDSSWMPEGLLDTFTAEEITDLLTYLQSSPR